VFLVCFSVTDPETLENVKRNWLSEIRILSPKASYILVGTKTDMRENSDVINQLKEKNKRPVSSQEGVKFATANGAKTYVECSAMNKDGLQRVFEQCVMVATNRPTIKLKEKCKEKSNQQCTIS
jgi:Ras-related C3 botulinum toxin substrate 1